MAGLGAGEAGLTGWLPYAQVEDVDAATKRAVRLGAVLLKEKTHGPAGEFTIVRDRDAIAAATALLERTLADGRPGPLQVEAAIAAVHCRATQASDTNWREIAALYALLETFRPAPAVRANRAFAVARATDAGAGLALLDSRAGGIDVTSYPYAHLVRGALLAELGRLKDAEAEFMRAHEVARNASERAQIQSRLVELRARAEERRT